MRVTDYSFSQRSNAFSRSKLGSSGLVTAAGLADTRSKIRTVDDRRNLLLRRSLELGVLFLRLLNQLVLLLLLLLQGLGVPVLLKRPAVKDTVADTSDQSRVADDLWSASSTSVPHTLTRGVGDIDILRRSALSGWWKELDLVHGLCC